MTYIISVAIQIAVVVAVVAIVLLLVRQGRPQGPDETQTALNRLHDDIGLTQETILNALGDRIARSAAETRQIVLERFDQFGKVERQMEEMSQRHGEIARRLQESNSHVTSLIHRFDELSVRLVELFQRKLSGLTSQFAELQKRQPADFAAMTSRIHDAISQAVTLTHQNEELVHTVTERLDRAETLAAESHTVTHSHNERLTDVAGTITRHVERIEARDAETTATTRNQMGEISRTLAAVADRVAKVEGRTTEIVSLTDQMIAGLRESQATLARVIEQWTAGPAPYVAGIKDKLADLDLKQQEQIASLKEQLHSLETRWQECMVRLEALKSGIPLAPDYGPFAVTRAIPIPPTSVPDTGEVAPGC